MTVICINSFVVSLDYIPVLVMFFSLLLSSSLLVFLI